MEGDRVVLTQDVERFPHFIARKGLTGVVTEIYKGLFAVRMDGHLDGAESWDNEIVWTDDIHGCGPPEADLEIRTIKGEPMTNHKTETRTTVLAQKFTELLTERFSVEERADVAIRNRENGDDAVCHSHDFCDANVFMWEAWEGVFPFDMDLQDQAHMDIINGAWDEARGRWWYLWVWMPFLDALAARLSEATVSGADDDGDVMYGRLRYRGEDVSLWCDPDGGTRGTISVEVGHWNEQGRIVYAGDINDTNSVARAVIRSPKPAYTVRRISPADDGIEGARSEAREDLDAHCPTCKCHTVSATGEVCLGCPTHCHAE